MVYIYNLSFKLTKFQKYSLSLIKHHKHSKTYPHRHTCPSVSFSCVCVCVACLHAQSCLTLCDLMHCSTPGSSFYGIFQARILEWVAISSPGDLPDPRVEPRSLASQADSLLGLVWTLFLPSPPKAVPPTLPEIL